MAVGSFRSGFRRGCPVVVYRTAAAAAESTVAGPGAGGMTTEAMRMMTMEANRCWCNSCCRPAGAGAVDRASPRWPSLSTMPMRSEPGGARADRCCTPSSSWRKPSKRTTPRTGQIGRRAVAGPAGGTVAAIGCGSESPVQRGNFWQYVDCCFVHFQLFDGHELQ